MSLIIICGATATGKSELALSVAKELDAEIVNADSMQVYRGMDIGTAKLALEDRQGITHHLLDLLEITQEANVSWYQGLARAKIVDDLNFPDTDPVVRQQITDEAQIVGNDQMHERLAKLDPAAALAIPKENIRRVIRALEVIQITGKPFTANLPRQASSKYPEAKQFGLVLDRENLDSKIDKRVEDMWAKGFVREVMQLMTKGLDGSRKQLRTVRKTVG